MSKRLFIATVAVMVSFNAYAQPKPVDEWVAECSSNNPVDLSACDNYALGLTDGLILWQQKSPKTALVCFPEARALTAKQLREVGLRYLNARPGGPPHLTPLLTEAFMTEWPCKS
jgi:Rap1a immunity proteins